MIHESTIIFSKDNQRTSVDNTSCCGCLDTLPDGPLPDFIGTSSEKAGQVQYLAHGNNDLGQGRLGVQLLALLLCNGVITEMGQTLLKANGNGDDRITRGVGLDPFSNFGKVLVLLANVIPLAKVNQVHNWLSGKEEKRINNLDLE